MKTSKEQTADDLIQLLMDAGCPKSRLHTAVKRLISLAYVNSDFIDALFRAQNITEHYNLIRNK